MSIFSETFIKRNKNNFSLRGLFIEEFPLLYFYIFIFDDLLNKHIPKLKKHLIEYDIPNDVWIIKWFQTAFTIILPINWSKKLWDNIFCSDFFFIIKFSISLCFFLSKDILGLNDTQLIMDYFRNIQKIPMNYTNDFLEKKLEINNLFDPFKLTLIFGKTLLCLILAFSLSFTVVFVFLILKLLLLLFIFISKYFISFIL